MFRPLLIAAMIRPPTSTFQITPSPPKKLVPPMMTAAIA